MYQTTSSTLFAQQLTVDTGGVIPSAGLSPALLALELALCIICGMVEVHVGGAVAKLPVGDPKKRSLGAMPRTLSDNARPSHILALGDSERAETTQMLVAVVDHAKQL